MMDKPSSLGHAPAGERWEFDFGVAKVFDDMLERSIPQLGVMRGLVTDVTSAYVRPATAVVDLGCSRGDALAPLIARFGAHNRYVGVDASEPMLDAARARFADYGDLVSIRRLDLRREYPPEATSATLAVLTLMFVPINYRLRLVQQAYDHLLPGGVLVVVEKVLGATAGLDALMVERYHRMKHESGYTWEEIDRKRLSLEGVQVPVTARWNEEALAGAGFRQVDCFWRWMNFAAWAAVRD